ncbi:hypothetical protein [Agromyces silvae]|uniref:hypothetical protein n=1 Tax=Agromyces silvae TaxID=3388266 RepID=UPI00280A6BCC|nr:hypothetical protein [Agromyces protaetiae]
MRLDSMPTTTIWWGIGLAVGGALLIAISPPILNAMFLPNSPEWSTAAELLNLVLTIARAVLPPLGAALIAAGLVMKYVDARLRGERIADRPRRWRWPDQRDADSPAVESDPT